MSSSLLDRSKRQQHHRPETAKSRSNAEEISTRNKSELAFDGGKSVIIDAPLSPSKYYVSKML
jgi:hypothetical protein